VPISDRNFFRPFTNVVAAVAIVWLLALSFSGCGETYRPVANPIPKPGGDPQSAHYALVLNSNNGQPPNPSTTSPSVSQIDVSGDIALATHLVGRNPVFLSMSPSFGLVYIINKTDNTLNTYSPLAGAGATIATIPLIRPGEPDADASYVATSSGLAFVAETALNRVAIVDGSQLQVRSFVPVGVSPVSITNTSDGRKVYVANQGDDTISVISTLDDSNQKTIPVGSSPGPITISSDNSVVFVANQGSGTVSEIDTTTDTVIATLTVGTNPTQVVWDNNLKRVYVVNTGSGSITIIDAHAVPATVLRTVTTSPSPVNVAPLANGTKFYVLILGSGSGPTGTPGTVEVYDAVGFFKRITVTVGYNALPGGALPALNQVLLSASPSSTKVYAVNYNGDPTNPTGSTSIIRTLDDTVVANVASPAPNPIFVAIE
jgi:YVTN family beta-propeller protein